MVLYRTVKDYMGEAGATNDKIYDLLDFFSIFLKSGILCGTNVTDLGQDYFVIAELIKTKQYLRFDTTK